MIKLKLIRNVALTAPIFIAMIAAMTIATTLAMQKPKPISQTRTVTVKATIEAIDKTNRIITLKGAKGNLVDVYATDKVKRFDELKVGDVITATYSESIAIRVRKPGEPAPETGAGEPRDVAPGVDAAEPFRERPDDGRVRQPVDEPGRERRHPGDRGQPAQRVVRARP